ncbi:MAG TPA: hypothetical protein VH393_15380 [Ktedonobacterales bacterium]
MRYLTAVIFLVIAALLALQWYVGMQVQTTSGVIASVSVTRDTSSGEHQEHRVKLEGRNDSFIVEKQYFSPTLSDDTLQQGAQVEFWYVQTSPFDPDVIALQVTDASGTTKYVTPAYTDPQSARMSGLITAGVFALLGLFALIAAIWLPAPGGSNSGRKQAAPNYGDSVVGPPR